VTGRREIAVGGARWSLADRPDVDAADAVIGHALDRGVTLFDTAAAYTPASPAGGRHNEELLAAAIARHRLGGRARVATKGGHTRASAGDFPIDASPAALRRDCEGSLRALGVERIWLYLLHWPDPNVPWHESVGALAALRDDGLVEHVGVCNVTVDQLDAALDVTEIAAVQNHLSIVDRHDPVVDRCTERSIPYLAYSPFGGPRGAADLPGAVPGLAAVARRHDVGAHTVALAWLLARSPVVVPVVGAGRPASVDGAIAAIALELDDDDLAALPRYAP